MYYYNVLNDNDLKTIKDLIVVFLLNKYNYIKNKDDFLISLQTRKMIKLKETPYIKFYMKQINVIIFK